MNVIIYSKLIKLSICASVKQKQRENACTVMQVRGKVLTWDKYDKIACLCKVLSNLLTPANYSQRSFYEQTFGMIK